MTKTENDVISGMDAQQIDQAINSTREQIEAQIKEEHALIGARLPLVRDGQEKKIDLIFLEIKNYFKLIILIKFLK